MMTAIPPTTYIMTLMMVPNKPLKLLGKFAVVPAALAPLVAFVLSAPEIPTARATCVVATTTTELIDVVAFAKLIYYSHIIPSLKTQIMWS